MTMPGLVVVKEEMSKLDADVVVSFLVSEGIDAIVNADDAAGTIPALDETRFAQVLVPQADAERARALIAEHSRRLTVVSSDDEDDDLDEEDGEADEDAEA
jgi:hypothetical protein